MSRLAKYLEAAAISTPGWQVRYEHDACGGSSPAYITGHYCGLLDDVVRVVGLARLTRLVAAHDEIDKREEE